MPRTLLIAALAALGATVAAPSLAAQAPPPDSALIRRTLRLHRDTPMIDGHNDFPWEVRTQAQLSLDRADMGHGLPSYQTDIARLRAGGVGGQFWSIYMADTMLYRGAMKITMEQIDIVHRMVERWPETFELARTADDVERIHRAGRIASLLGIEGGHAIENSLCALRQFYELGARYMTLTWNNGLAWADAAMDSSRHNGLTAFGREVVREMNRLGMLVDISHVSDSVMAHVLRISEAPVIFSHSSARAIANHPRNVPDGVLRMLPRNGGVVMVNFYCAFTDPAWVPRALRRHAAQQALRARFSNDSAAYRRALAAWDEANPRPPVPSLGIVADHIEHIRRVAGVDHVGYGSDFDGIDCAPQGLEDVSMFPRLTAELLRRGWSDADVRKVIWGNVLRVMRQAEAVATRLRQGRGPSAATLAELDSAGVR